MSGTSMDGIDVALLKTDGESEVSPLAGSFFPYTPDIRKMLEQSLKSASDIKDREERPGNLAAVEQEITRLHSEAVSIFLQENSLQEEQIDVLGFHGQTVLHRPENGLTLQLGDGDALAVKTGIKTVYDMRNNDMMHSGQGAPLVPVYHQALSQRLPQEFSGITPVAFVNIGGISNITFVGDELLAFDSGPGNSLIDQWVQQQVGISHDQGGMIAAEGKTDPELVEQYLADPFFSKPLPKSLDRTDFTLPQNRTSSVENVARSLAHLSARAIFASLEHLPQEPQLWVICGGGRHNPHIMGDLRKLAKTHDTCVISSEEAGFDGDSMEAEAWAYLAVRALKGLPLTFPGTTGVHHAVTGGRIAHP